MAVELHQAWMWDCPEYGRENFERSVTAELTPAEAKETATEMGLLDEQAEYVQHAAIRGDFCTKPNEVTCKHCSHVELVEE